MILNLLVFMFFTPLTLYFTAESNCLWHGPSWSEEHGHSVCSGAT